MWRVGGRFVASDSGRAIGCGFGGCRQSPPQRTTIETTTSPRPAPDPSTSASATALGKGQVSQHHFVDVELHPARKIQTPGVARIGFGDLVQCPQGPSNGGAARDW